MLDAKQSNRITIDVWIAFELALCSHRLQLNRAQGNTEKQSNSPACNVSVVMMQEKNLNNILSFVIKHNSLHIVLLTTHTTDDLMKVKLYENVNAKGEK